MTTKKETTMEVLDVTKLENQVIDMVKFDVLKSDLVKMVEESKKIVYDLEDQKSVELAKKTRKEIRNKEIIIEKNGLSFRGIFNKISKSISGMEKELTKITNPEVERLKKIENDSAELILKKERMEKLPIRKERLVKINDGVEVSDETLLGLDSTEFETYYNVRVADKNESDRIALEKKAQEEADLKAKQAQEQADLLAKQQKDLDDERERLAKEKADFEAKKAETNTLAPTETPQNQTGAQDFEEIVNDTLDEQTPPMATAQTAEVGNTEEQNRRVAYANFLKDNGYNQQNKADYLQQKNNLGEWELFKKVAVFKE